MHTFPAFIFSFAVVGKEPVTVFCKPAKPCAYCLFLFVEMHARSRRKTKTSLHTTE